MNNGIWGAIAKSFEKGLFGKPDRNARRITRYHATRPELVENILSEGLKPSKGPQSHIAGDDFGEGIWLSGTPYNIPVPYPDIQVLRVNLPIDEYYKSQRVYFPGNKALDGSKPVIRQPGESAMPSHEGLAYAEFFKNPIASEYIQPISVDRRYYNPADDYRQSVTELGETVPAIKELYKSKKYAELDELLRSMPAENRYKALADAIPTDWDELDVPYKLLRGMGYVLTKWEPGKLPVFVPGIRAARGHISEPFMHKNPPTARAAAADATGTLSRIRQSWFDSLK